MAEGALRELTTHEEVMAVLEEMFAEATNGISVAVPADRIDAVAESLQAAYDRGCLVLLIVYDDGTPLDPARFEGMATVVRQTSTGIPPFVVTTDLERGLSGHWSLLSPNSTGRQATYFESPNLTRDLSTVFLGNYWFLGDELYVREWDELPTTHSDVRAAVTQAALLLQNDVDVWVHTEGRPTDDPTAEVVDIDGRLLNVRQNIVTPTTSGFPAEASLTVAFDDREVTLGGPGALVEDYECSTFTFREGPERA